MSSETTAVRLPMRDEDELNMFSVLRCTSAPTRGRALRNALQGYCAMWQATQAGRQVALLHFQAQQRMTINMPRSVAPREKEVSTPLVESAPARRVGTLTVRLEPEEMNALNMIASRTATSREQVLRVALATHALVVERCVHGTWRPISLRDNVDVLPLPVPGVYLVTDITPEATEHPHAGNSLGGWSEHTELLPPRPTPPPQPPS